MGSITVSADRNYNVEVDVDWTLALAPFLAGRGQVAIIVS